MFCMWVLPITVEVHFSPVSFFTRAHGVCMLREELVKLYESEESDECRSCGAPKVKAESELLQCTKCYEKVLFYTSADSFELARFVSRGDVQAWQLEAVASVPIDYLKAFAASGQKIIFLKEGEKVQSLQTISRLIEVGNLSSVMVAIKGIIEGDVGEHEASELNTDGTCSSCGKTHADGSGSTYAFISPKSRYSELSTNVTIGAIRNLVLFNMLAMYSSSQDVCEALHTIMLWKAKRYTMMNSDFDTMTNDQKNKLFHEHCISKLSISSWRDYMAEAILACNDLNSECSFHRLVELSTDTGIAVQDMTTQLHKDIDDLKAEITNKHANASAS